MKFGVFVAPVLSLCAYPALAETPAPPPASAPQINPAAVDEALRMLEAGEFEAQVLKSTDVMMEGMLAVATERMQKEAGEPIPEEFLASFRKTLLEHASTTMKSKMPHMKRQAAEIYASEFTVEELRRMREIETDPVIMKARAKSQALSAKLMMVGMQAMRDSESALESKIEQVVNDYLKSAGLLNEEKS